MRHVALEKLYTLAGGFSGDDGGRCAMVPGTYRPYKMGPRYQTPGNPVGDVSVNNIPLYPESGTSSKHYISLDI